jgi:hypothetical protein
MRPTSASSISNKFTGSSKVIQLTILTCAIIYLILWSGVAIMSVTLNDNSDKEMCQWFIMGSVIGLSLISFVFIVDYMVAVGKS